MFADSFYLFIYYISFFCKRIAFFCDITHNQHEIDAFDWIRFLYFVKRNDVYYLLYGFLRKFA